MRLPLWFIILCSVLGYWLIRFWFPLFPAYNQSPLADIRTFTPGLVWGVLYGVLLVGLCGLCFQAYRQVQQMEKPPAWWIILGTAFLFYIPLLQTFPFNATDIYRYLMRGRISSFYGENPYTTPPSAFPNDLWAETASDEWKGETSPYGPVWELTAATLTSISQGDLYLALLLFKGFEAAVHLVSAVFIWHSLNSLGAAERAARTILWAWNPCLLLILVADAHNDGLMLLWLLAAWWLLQNGRFTSALVVATLSPLSKPIGLLVLPFFWLAVIRSKGLKENWLVLSGGILGSIGLVWLAFRPFGSPLELGQRLVREASAGAGFSVSTLVILLGQSLALPLKVSTTANIALVIFGLLGLWLLWLGWNGRSALRGTADIFLAYTLQALNFRIWYAAWPFPWLLLDDNPSPTTHARLRLGFAFLLTSQLSVLIYGHLRAYALGGNHLWSHLIGVPFTFVLPYFWATSKGKTDESSVFPSKFTV